MKRRTAHDAYGNLPQSDRPMTETPLRAWLERQGVTAYSLAEKVGCSYFQFRQWRDGRALPGLVYAFKLERETAGGVPVSSWLGTELAKRMWDVTADWETWKQQKRDGVRRLRRKGAKRGSDAVTP